MSMSDSEISPQQAWQVYQQARCLYERSAVETALDSMAQHLTADLADHNPLFLCVMSGALIPMGHLLTRLEFPLEIDYLHATRYRGQTQGGEIHWLARSKTHLQGRTVVVVDDILDEGYTLAAILEDCRIQGAADIRTAVLVNKNHERRYQGLSADYIGLEVDDHYVFGYGMDYHGYLRNVAGIYAVVEQR